MRIRAYADLHMFFNRDERPRYLKELEVIKQELRQNPVDLLVFAGDLMDKAFSMDDIVMPDIFRFVKDILDICVEKGIIFRIIKGTASHDCKIIEVLNEIYFDHPMFRSFVVPTIETLNIKSKDYSIRWLPESYGTLDEYNEMVSNIFNCTTDMTFFHGSVKSVFNSLGFTHNDISTLPKAYLWEDELLLQHTRLFSAGGHIHKTISVMDKIFYINSYTCWSFDQNTTLDNPNTHDVKGYMEFDVDDYGFTFNRIKNNMSPNYYTVKLDNIESYEPYDLEEYIKSLMIRLDNNDKLRVIVNGKVSKRTNINLSLLKQLSVNSNIVIKSNIKFNDDNSEIILDEDTPEENMSISIVDKIHTIYENDYGFIERKNIEQYLEDEDINT